MFMGSSGSNEPFPSDHICRSMSTPSTPKFTDKQGQYLVFIHLYTKVNRQPPAQADIQRYFQVTPPSVHSMIVTLEKRGLIRRQPGRARAIEVLVAPAELPDLR
jgi:DNA-binding MarR family transcriptional regulator